MKIHGVEIAIIIGHHDICDELVHFIGNHDVDVVMVHAQTNKAFEPEPIPYRRLEIQEFYDRLNPQVIKNIQPHKFFDKPRNNWKRN